MTVTDRLVEERKQEMRRRMEERITTAVEREALARERIREELVGLAEAGDLQRLRERFDELARPEIEAIKAALAQALASSGVAPGDISAVEVTGGASRGPLVAAVVKAVLGEDR